LRRLVLLRGKELRKLWVAEPHRRTPHSSSEGAGSHGFAKKNSHCFRRKAVRRGNDTCSCSAAEQGRVAAVEAARIMALLHRALGKLMQTERCLGDECVESLGCALAAAKSGV